SEHDDRVSGSQFHNRRSHGPPRRRQNNAPVHQRLGCHPTRGSGSNFPGRSVDEDGDVNMSNGHDRSFQRKFNPYGRGSRRWDNRIAEDQRKTPERCRLRGGSHLSGNEKRSGGLSISGKSKTWYKITIPYGKKHDKKWLLTALQNLCPIPFTPVHYSVEGQKVQFFVDDDDTANALRSISRKIVDIEGYKVVVIMNPCPPPYFLQNDLKDEDLEHLKQCMSKRFDVSEQFLDLNSIRSDQDLISQNINVILSRKSCMEAVLKIIKENVPQLTALNLSNNKLYKLDDLAEMVNTTPNLSTLNLSHNELKSERELDKLKGLKLTELWLDHNPLCDHFTDQSSYISAVRDRFPKLLKLDGHNLPTPIGFDVETCTAIPPSKDSYFVSSDVKEFILRFLHQYYSVYDSGNRQPLLDAYHDEACFSLSLQNAIYNVSNLLFYQQVCHQRKSWTEMETVLEKSLIFLVSKCFFLMQKGETIPSFWRFNLSIGGALLIDLDNNFSYFIFFSVPSVDVKSKENIRAFSRVFVGVPAMNNALCLVNDTLFVRHATIEEVRRAFAPLAPTPSCSPVSTNSPSQQEMIFNFSQKYQMNLEWSQKWLQQNEWDFNRAVQLFLELKVRLKV
ncbi:nuclear RNA export factor 1, partial [Silurus asotus]